MPCHRTSSLETGCRHDVMNRLYGLHLTDLGPYRAVRSDLLESLKMTEMTFGWPTEMTVKAARAGADHC